MDLREKLQILREETKLNQESFAKKYNIALGTLKKYESKDIENPSLEVLTKYVNIFNVSYDYLLDDNIENRIKDNVNIGEVLHLSDKSIKNLKNIPHKAFDLLLSSNYFSEINGLLDFYFKLKYLLNKLENLHNIKISKDELYNFVEEIYDISYENDSVCDLDNVYDSLLTIKSNFERAKTADEVLDISVSDFDYIETTISQDLEFLEFQILKIVSKFLEDTNYKK